MKKTLFGLLICAALTQPIYAQDEKITNSSILEMVKLGFSNDIIISKINSSTCNFDTSIDSLKTLKEMGVNNDIIIAMINHAPANNNKNNDTDRSGIYYKNGDEFIKILPSVFSGSQTNTLATAFSYGLANTKIKSTMDGAHSSNVVATNSPEFYFYFNANRQGDLGLSATNWWFSAASSPNEFTLVELVSKKGRRELETGKINLYAGSTTGIDGKKAIKVNIEVINDHTFKVTPQFFLDAGEYCFFFKGNIPHGGYSNQSVFDFSIPRDLKLNINSLFDKGDYVWVLEDEEPKSYEIMSTHINSDGVYYGIGRKMSADVIAYISEKDCYKSKKELKQALNIE